MIKHFAFIAIATSSAVTLSLSSLWAVDDVPEYIAYSGLVRKIDTESKGAVYGKVLLEPAFNILAHKEILSQTVPYFAYTSEFDGGSLFEALWPPPPLIQDKNVAVVMTVPTKNFETNQNLQSVVIMPPNFNENLWNIRTLNDAKIFFKKDDNARSSELRRLGYIQCLRILKEDPETALSIVSFIQSLQMAHQGDSSFELSFEMLPRWYALIAEKDPFVWEAKDYHLALKFTALEMLKKNSPSLKRAVGDFKKTFENKSAFDQKRIMDEMRSRAENFGSAKRAVFDETIGNDEKQK